MNLFHSGLRIWAGELVQVLNWFYNNRNKPYAKIAREAHAPVSTRQFGANHQQEARGSSISKLKPTHAGSSSGDRCYL